jgi:hypothetical protein
MSGSNPEPEMIHTFAFCVGVAMSDGPLCADAGGTLPTLAMTVNITTATTIALGKGAGLPSADRLFGQFCRTLYFVIKSIDKELLD